MDDRRRLRQEPTTPGSSRCRSAATTLGPEIDAYNPIEDGIDYNQVATFSNVNVATLGSTR